MAVAHLALFAGVVVSDRWDYAHRRANQGNFVTVSLLSSEEMKAVADQFNSSTPPASSEVQSSANIENQIPLPVTRANPSSHSHVPSVYQPPVFLVRENPVYPEAAQAAGLQGKVTVKVYISPRGEVKSTEIIESSGSVILDEAALRAAQSSRFNPAEKDHQPVDAEATASYRFELR